MTGPGTLTGVSLPALPAPARDVVTGEAVPLELRLAKLPTRGLALGIDIAVQVTLLLGLTALAARGVLGLDEAAGSAVALVLAVFVIVGYPLLWETLTRGRSLGKLALGLRVVRDDGGPVRFRHSLVRALVGVLEIWLTVGVPALVVSLASTTGKRIGDHLGGTVVVRERVPAGGGAMVAMPPQLAGWAQGLDLRRLTSEQALAVRQFLARAPQLAPAVRADMGRRLALEVAAVVSPLAPAGTTAEAYLAAVSAEHRRRAMPVDTPATAPPAGPAPPGPAVRPAATVPPATAAPPAAVPPATTVPTTPPPDGFAPPG